MARPCYRYRTRALVGPWRRRRDQAEGDAVAARLAEPDASGLAWRVPGEIEEGSCEEGGPCKGASPPRDRRGEART